MLQHDPMNFSSKMINKTGDLAGISFKLHDFGVKFLI
jgi:hypothetical protein